MDAETIAAEALRQSKLIHYLQKVPAIGNQLVRDRRRPRTQLIVVTKNPLHPVQGRWGVGLSLCPLSVVALPTANARYSPQLPPVMGKCSERLGLVVGDQMVVTL
jgi:hypothetical protein